MSTANNPNDPLRWFRIVCRTGHIAAASVYVGARFAGMAQTELMPWLVATVITGTLLILTDVLRKPIWLRELRGVGVLIKVAILIAIPLWPASEMVVLFVVIGIGGVVSHMPGHYRYWVVGRGPTPRK